jgi:hypothetical protein
MPNPDPALDVPFLSNFIRECHWMQKSKNWRDRLLYRLAKDKLDTLTQQALAEGQEPKGKWEKKVAK